MRFFDLFGGIGAFSLVLTRLGWKCAGYLDRSTHAVAVYNHNFGTNHVPIDADEMDWNSLPDFDCLCAGFSCKPYSRAGDQSGLDHAEGSGLDHVLTVLDVKRPAYFLLENVPNLVTDTKFREIFAHLLNTCGELGYDTEWQILDSRDVGSPQSRKRVYIVGSLGGDRRRQILPLHASERIHLSQEYECQSEGEWIWGRDRLATLTANYRRGVHAGGEPYLIENHLLLPDHYIGAYYDVIEDEIYYTTKYPRHDEDQLEAVICPHHLDDFSICDCMGVNSVFDPDICELELFRVRRFTPLEVERFQGFPENWTQFGSYNGRTKPVADTNRYTMLGNSIQVQTLTAICQALTNTIGETNPVPH